MIRPVIMLVLVLMAADHGEAGSMAAGTGLPSGRPGIDCVVIDRATVGVLQSSPQRIMEVDIYEWCRFPHASNRWLRVSRGWMVNGKPAESRQAGTSQILWDSVWAETCKQP